MFHDTANPLQRMVDSGTQFVNEADANTDDTITLLDTGKTVLQTQADHEKDIQAFAQGSRRPDRHAPLLRQGHPHPAPGRCAGAVREVDALLKGLEPTLPVFLSNLITTNQVLTTQHPGRASSCSSCSRT